MTARASSLPRVLIVDHPATRLGVRMALDGAAVVCGEADDVLAAVAIAVREQPDVCLLGMQGATSGEHVRLLREAIPGGAVVAMAHEPDPEQLLAAVRAGAAGYVPASIERDALRRVVQSVGAGEAAVPRTLVRDLMHAVEVAANGGRGGLTVREVQVLGMVRRGRSTAEIADRLHISQVTVRRHVSALMRKTGVENRAGLAEG